MAESSGTRHGRGYKWEQFAPGHQVNRTHGTQGANRSEEIADEVAAMAEAVAVTFPWTAAYLDERRAYARALLDERDIERYLDKVGHLDEKGQERSAVRTLERFANRAARCRVALGLQPMAHAKLLSLLSDVVRAHPERAGHDPSLDALLAEGRAALLRASERPAVSSARLSAEDAHSEEEAQA